MTDRGQILRLDTDGTHALEMPYGAMLEMILDWRGAGRAITERRGNVWHPSETRDWYLKNRHKMLLHPDTRRWVERTLGVPPDS